MIWLLLIIYLYNLQRMYVEETEVMGMEEKNKGHIPVDENDGRGG